jgi:predicted N-acetyltransferase YhbS
MEGGIKPDASMKRPATGPAGGHRVRALSPEDADDAAALIRAAFAAQPAPTDPPPSALRDTADSVRARLVAGGGFGAEARGGGGLVGVVLWASEDGGLYLGRLAVSPAWRRRGVARALVGAAKAEARARRLPRLLLGARLVLAENRRLFAGLGFRETALEAHPGYDAPTSVRMEKTLPPGGVG